MNTKEKSEIFGVKDAPVKIRNICLPSTFLPVEVVVQKVPEVTTTTIPIKQPKERLETDDSSSDDSSSQYETSNDFTDLECNHECMNNKRSNNNNDDNKSNKKIRSSAGLALYKPNIAEGLKGSKQRKQIEQVTKKLGNQLTDLLFNSLNNMKKLGILSVNLDIPGSTITVVDSEETLLLHSNLYFKGNNQKNQFKEISPSAINVGKDLHILLNLFSKLPHNPPMRDKIVFTKNKDFRQALIDHLEMIHRNNKEFEFFRGTQRVELNQVDEDLMPAKVSIKIQNGLYFSINNLTDDFNNVAKQLAKSIYKSVNGQINEQVNKELSRRKELRLHVEMFKAYTQLQAFCALNLKREQGETTRSQAKILIIKYFPHVSIQNMNLMLQRAPRIYRLLLLSDGDYRLIDSFEELSPSFFKSSMKSAVNFDIWINLVKTGQLVNYVEGPTMRENGKRVMREAKLNIIKSYFDGVNDNLKDLIVDGDGDDE